MEVFLEQLINGLTIGSFYALIALGYSMVYGILKLINFAHGDFFTLGSYVGYTVLVFGSAFITTHFGLWGGLIAAMIIAAVCVAFVGVMVERAAYRPIYPAGRLTAVVSALGARRSYPQHSHTVRRHPHHHASDRYFDHVVYVSRHPLLDHTKNDLRGSYQSNGPR